MNILLVEIRRTLNELTLGLNGDLAMSPQMDKLLWSLHFNRVPDSWATAAYPSMLSLNAWFEDLLKRNKQLDSWSSEFAFPAVIWLPGLFNPQAFLTAVMQTSARRFELPLDKMQVVTEVTKKTVDDIQIPPREGAYISGVYLEGARWDVQMSYLVDSTLKEPATSMPVIYLKAVTSDKVDTRDVYQCPLYRTSQRGPSFVANFQLKTRASTDKWIQAGVSLLLDPN